jgi:hypothetical protein
MSAFFGTFFLSVLLRRCQYLDYTASNGRMAEGWWTGKDLVGINRGLIGALLWHSSGRPEKNTKNLSQDFPVAIWTERLLKRHLGRPEQAEVFHRTDLPVQGIPHVRNRPNGRTYEGWIIDSSHIDVEVFHIMYVLLRETLSYLHTHKWHWDLIIMNHHYDTISLDKSSLYF